MSGNMSQKSKWEWVDPIEARKRCQLYTHTASDAVLKSRKPERLQHCKSGAHARTISGQFPCPCVTFGSPNHQELSRVWDARLRRRFKDEPTRDDEGGEDETGSYGKETATRYEGNKIMYPSTSCMKETSRHGTPSPWNGIPSKMKSQTNQVRRAREDETRPYTKGYEGNKITYPFTSGMKETSRHEFPSTMKFQTNQVGRVEEHQARPYTKEATTRFDGHKIMYPSTTTKKEARHGFSSIKSRTCQMGSRVCRSLANRFRAYTNGPFNLVGALASRDNLATIPPDGFRYPIPTGSNMVVPRCFQFHSQVISGGRPHISERNFQEVQSLEAIYEPPSHEDDDGVSPDSINAQKTSSFNLDDVIHQLQEEHDWSDLNSRQLHTQGISRERWSHFIPEKSSRQGEEFEGFSEQPQGGRGRFKEHHSNDGDESEFCSELPNEFRGVYSDSSGVLDHHLVSSSKCRHVTNAKQFSRTSQVVDGCSALDFEENNRKFRSPDLDMPERDSNCHILDGRLPNSSEIGDKFIRHLFGTDYDVTKRNYKRFNDKVQHILNYDISDLLLGEAQLTPKGTTSSGFAPGDKSSEDALELKFQHTLDSLQTKIKTWKVTRKAS